MVKRPFFSFIKPRLRYPFLSEDASIAEIPLSLKATLLLDQECVRLSELYACIGKRVKTGQIIRFKDNNFISPVTGTIKDVSEYIGYMNQKFYLVSIEVEDDEYEDLPKNYIPFSVPGFKNISSLIGYDPPINHIVIMGMDSDLFVSTNQLVIKNRSQDISKGIKYLQEIAHIGKISFIVPTGFDSYIKEIGNDIYVIKPFYPNAIPKIIVKDVFKKIIPPGKEPKDIGIEFINAEAVANMGSLLEGKFIFDKLITIISKDYSILYVKARIGTNIGHILNQLDIELSNEDRIIIGGLMRGRTVHSLDFPIDYDTDAIFIQSKDEIIHASDTHCINCGECVNICPVNVPVNMLIRVLENGFFEEAAKEYDLLSCVECGLCSYVCIARIPIFHYIMLGKHELSKMGEQNA